MACTHEDDPSYDALLEGVSEGIAILVGIQSLKGKEARKASHDACEKLIPAHILVTGALGSCLTRMNGLRVPVSPGSLDRDAIIAAFVVGLSVCEDAILEARYVQSSALLRQELEMLALLSALRAGEPPKGKTPNVARLTEDLRRLYSSLTNMTHLTDRDLIGDLHSILVDTDAPGDTRFTRQFPVASASGAQRQFSLQIMVILKLIEELNFDMQRCGIDLAANEIQACNKAMDILVQEGMAIAE